MGNQYETNWKTHVQTRLRSTLFTWVRNHIRAYLSEDELKDEAKARAALRRRFDDYEHFAPFWGQDTQDRYNN